MPYKIVQTVEKGKSVLTSIPDTWEDNGILKWPKKKAEKLKKNDNNGPDNSWLKSRCTVTLYIESYEEAEKEIERMCDYSDTEPYADTENEDLGPAKQKRRHHKLQPTTFHNKNFDNLAQECLKVFSYWMCIQRSTILVQKRILNDRKDSADDL